MATVDYNGKTVSDENIQTVLQRIADKLESDLKVTSGDRSGVVTGSSKKSHHIQKRAADFHLDKFTDEEGFKKIKEKKSDIFDTDKKYQMIIHGPHTNTSGAHLHIGRYSTGSGTVFMKEGMDKDSSGKYTLAAGNLVPPDREVASNALALARYGLADEDVC